MITTTLLLCSLVLAGPARFPGPAPGSVPARASGHRIHQGRRRVAVAIRYKDPVVSRHLRGKTVLFVGDSMIVSGLDIWARYWVRKNGGTYFRRYMSSSTIKTWATTSILDRALKRYHPHLVFLVLGSNDLYLTNPGRQARHVRTILGKLGQIPFFWIGPPRWAPDTGIIKVFARTIPAGRFYPFNDHRIGRARDGKHPSLAGSKTWARDIFAWFARRLRKEGRL